MLSNRLRDLYLRYARKEATAEYPRRRNEVLRFRDIRDDKHMQIHGDFFSSFKLLSLGKEYAIDYALHSSMDFSQYDALRELSLNDGKLIEGPFRLLKSGIPFPTISEIGNFADYRMGSKCMIPLTYRSFKKATLVHFSHVMSTGEANASLWNDIVPMEEGNPVVKIVTLHNFQTFSSKLLQRIILKILNKNIKLHPDQHYFGLNLVPKFMSTFDIRNFYLNYVMLVDHKGHVRWMSGWKPNAEEKNSFPILCRYLADANIAC